MVFITLYLYNYNYTTCTMTQLKCVHMRTTTDFFNNFDCDYCTAMILSPFCCAPWGGSFGPCPISIWNGTRMYEWGNFLVMVSNFPIASSPDPDQSQCILYDNSNTHNTQFLWYQLQPLILFHVHIHTWAYAGNLTISTNNEVKVVEKWQTLDILNLGPYLVHISFSSRLPCCTHAGGRILPLSPLAILYYTVHNAKIQS